MIGANDVSLFLVDWYTRFITMGGKLTTGNKNDQGPDHEPHQPESVRALQHMIDCVPFAPIGVTSYGFTESLDAFSTGNVAMMVCWATIGGCVYNPEPSKVSDKAEVAAVPADAGQTPRAIRGGWGLGIPKNLPERAQGPRVARDDVHHIGRRSTSTKFARHRPTRTAARRSMPELVAKHPLSAGRRRGGPERPDPRDRHIPQTFEIVGEAAREFNLALDRNTGRGDGMQEAQDASVAILQEGRPADLGRRPDKSRACRA